MQSSLLPESSISRTSGGCARKRGNKIAFQTSAFQKKEPLDLSVFTALASSVLTSSVLTDSIEPHGSSYANFNSSEVEGTITSKGCLDDALLAVAQITGPLLPFTPIEGRTDDWHETFASWVYAAYFARIAVALQNLIDQAPDANNRDLAINPCYQKQLSFLSRAIEVHFLEPENPGAGAILKLRAPDATTSETGYAGFLKSNTEQINLTARPHTCSLAYGSSGLDNSEGLHLALIPGDRRLSQDFTGRNYFPSTSESLMLLVYFDILAKKNPPLPLKELPNKALPNFSIITSVAKKLLESLVAIHTTGIRISWRYPSSARSGLQQFTTYSCAIEELWSSFATSLSSESVKFCERCGKPFIASKARAQSKRFCSRSCQQLDKSRRQYLRKKKE
ncbi:MAG: hypothetical protein HFJ66_04020 [Eggerthellaceae bacterium]|nr:hypothetical protein [Eggerthellaceae bacterium]